MPKDIQLARRIRGREINCATNISS
nr:unnamed protein product [Callosobruchus analis]